MKKVTESYDTLLEEIERIQEEPQMVEEVIEKPQMTPEDAKEYAKRTGQRPW